MARGLPQKLSVEEYICSMGQIFVAVCTKETIYNTVGGIEFCVGIKLVAYACDYYAPS